MAKQTKGAAQQDEQLQASIDKLTALVETCVVSDEDKAQVNALLLKLTALQERIGNVKAMALFVVITALIGALATYAMQYIALAAGVGMVAVTGNVVLGQLAYWGVLVASMWLLVRHGDTVLSVVLTIADWIASGYLWVKDQLQKAWAWLSGLFAKSEEVAA